MKQKNKFLDIYDIRDRRSFSLCLSKDDDKMTACGLAVDGSLNIQEIPGLIDCPICPEYLSVKARMAAWRSQGIEIGPGLEQAQLKLDSDLGFEPK